ncbi:MAG TPA: hypothetical protein VGN95_05240 [Pyrinomonadaceae bacterium]|jgi:hypothetical protein|nr:hypothetical protein [Pyrinomonadaceae bacterium]
MAIAVAVCGAECRNLLANSATHFCMQLAFIGAAAITQKMKVALNEPSYNADEEYA